MIELSSTADSPPETSTADSPPGRKGRTREWEKGRKESSHLQRVVLSYLLAEGKQRAETSQADAWHYKLQNNESKSELSKVIEEK